MRAGSRPLVICYHAVSGSWRHVLSVPPDTIERRLLHLLERGYRPVSAADIVGGADGTVFHVTFDDAFRSVLSVAPVLARLGIPFTVFACSGLADEGRPLDVPRLAQFAPRPAELLTLSWPELEELHRYGAEIGSHTVSHPRLHELDDASLAYELAESRRAIEERLGVPCRYLAYPFGRADERCRAAARAAGYEAAFTCPPFDAAHESDVFAIPRVGVFGVSATRTRARWALRNLPRPARVAVASARRLRRPRQRLRYAR